MNIYSRVSALSIEDTLLPHPFGQPGNTLISVDEGVGKMRAAVAARTDPGLVIFARTSAIRREGIEGATRRAKAYEAAGVDGIFYSGLRTREELEAMHAATPLPCVLGMMSPELQDDAFVVQHGARIGGWNHEPIEASTFAMYESLRGLKRTEGTVDRSATPSPGELMTTLSRRSAYDAEIDRNLH